MMKKDKLITILFFAVLIFFIARDIYKEYKIKHLNLNTKGIIIAFERGSQGRYISKYEYFVNGKRYIGAV